VNRMRRQGGKKKTIKKRSVPTWMYIFLSPRGGGGGAVKQPTTQQSRAQQYHIYIHAYVPTPKCTHIYIVHTYIYMCVTLVYIILCIWPQLFLVGSYNIRCLFSVVVAGEILGSGRPAPVPHTTSSVGSDIG